MQVIDVPKPYNAHIDWNTEAIRAWHPEHGLLCSTWR